MQGRRSARDFLAVALDVPRLDAAEDLVRRLAGVPGWLKVGAELFTSAGPSALAAAGSAARVFLDAKLHDIPNTVAGAVAAATRHGVGMLTLHAAGGIAMLRAAREAAEETALAIGSPRPLLVGVTVLTSLSPADLKELGIQASSVEEQVARMVDLALAAGLDGVVASPREAAAVRRRAGPGLRIVTPGVRPAGAADDDQRRTASAAEAIQAGADLLVVGRPVVRAPDPAAAARELVREIEAALGSRTA
ncbi:MAG TPA: orotidine-5'-phosphate decarboxylase [Myxococcota bacterium]|jgi:orotidine-5'-phosphate decarboxylase